MIYRQVLLPVPCYDFVPLTESALGPAKAEISGIPSSLDVTGECSLETQSWRSHRTCGFPAYGEL